MAKLGAKEAMNKLGKSAFHGPQRFCSPAILAAVSFCGLILLTTSVSGGTIPNRRTGAVDTSILEVSTEKTVGNRNMQPTNPAFANAGRQKGVEIWRIENFEPVKYPAKDFGKFYTGDSYIILNTKENKHKDLSWDVHFWLGSETSTDEAGAAAILTVQLDDSLNGDPIQHREVQDHESQLFLGYFKNDSDARKHAGEAIRMDLSSEYGFRQPQGYNRIPRYNAELTTPFKLFLSKQRLSKKPSEISLAKILPIKLPKPTVLKTSKDDVKIVSTKDSSRTPRQSKLVDEKRFTARSSQSMLTNEERLGVSYLDTDKSRRRPSNIPHLVHGRNSEKKASATSDVKAWPHAISNKFPHDDSKKLINIVPQQSIERVNVPNDSSKQHAKPPMDDSTEKSAKNSKISKLKPSNDGQNRERSIISLYLPTGDGIRYEKGGVASGFHHAEINAKGTKRLFQVKGKRNVRVRQVNLSISSMNRGDCFILDAGDDIHVYVGSSSKRVEKLKAISAANQIRDQDHHGRARVHIVDDFSSLLDKEEFFKVLGGGTPDQVPTESVAEDDAEFEKNDERSVTLYKISDETGSLKVDTISQKPLRQDMMDSRDCFILDTGSGIFVWVGKGATQQEKTQAMAKAQGFLQMKKYPAWTNIDRIVEGAESAPFKQYFSTWKDVGMAHTRLIRAANDDDSDSAEDEEFDPAILHALKKSGGRAIGFMPDNGDGRLEAVYRIENFGLSKLAPDMYGMLFGGDSYVIKYHYINKRGGQGYIIYYWQGKESTNDEKAASALHAIKLDNELNGTALQVRVAQGFEPRHFLKVFQGKLITFIGGHASGFKNVNNPETYEANGARLFRVRGTCREDVRADQRPAVAASLASDDVFVLETADKIYLWKGVGASDFEKEMAASVVERISNSKTLVEMNEGSEPSDFWTVLGGEAGYDKVLDPVYPPFLEPRLFHCRILVNGKFKVEEIHHFEQEDLDVDDIMVLDGGDEIYVWIGDGSTQEEREKSIDMARQYIRTDPSERSEETVPIVKILQGNEPRSFKRLFPAWDEDVWQSIPSYESLKEQTREANSRAANQV